MLDAPVSQGSVPQGELVDPSTLGQESESQEELVPELEEEDSEPQQDPEPQKEESKPTTKRRLKVAGEEMEFDLSNEADIEKLLKGFSLESASQKRFQEAAALKKQVEETLSHIKQLESNPQMLFDFAKQFGHDPLQLAEELLFEKFKYESMSPEQRELHDLKRETARLKEEAELHSKRQAEEQARIRQAQFAETLETDIMNLFQELGDKPDGMTVANITSVMTHALESGEDISVKDAYERIKHLSMSHRDRWLQSLEDADFERLPKSFLEKLRKYDVARVQKQALPGRKPSTTPPSPRTRKSSASVDSVLADMEKMYG